jgi:hypothetical protein
MRYVPGKSSPCSATHNGQMCVGIEGTLSLARNAQNADDLAVAAAALRCFLATMRRTTPELAPLAGRRAGNVGMVTCGLAAGQLAEYRGVISG